MRRRPLASGCEKFPFDGAIIHSLVAVSLFVAQGAVGRIPLSSRASRANEIFPDSSLLIYLRSESRLADKGADVTLPDS